MGYITWSEKFLTWVKTELGQAEAWNWTKKLGYVKLKSPEI